MGYVPPEMQPITQAQAPSITAEQMELIKATVAKDATPDELKLYLFDCARQGVHPLDRLVHFTKRGGKYTPITSIDFMRIRASETGEYAGSEDAIFGDLYENKFPVSATVTVWRLVQGQRCPFTATARWSEYKPEQNDFMWKRMPCTMLGKCAEALALRKGFPKQLAGLYAKEEMEQAERAPRQKALPAEQPSAPQIIGASAVQRPVGPNGGDSGTSHSRAPNPTWGGMAPTNNPDVPTTEIRHRASNVNPYTGEEYPPVPPGSYYVWKYEHDDHGWHHGWISTTGDTGMSALEVKTKRDIGEMLKAAAESKKPVVCRYNEKSWLQTIDWYVPAIHKTVDAAFDRALTEDDIPF